MKYYIFAAFLRSALTVFVESLSQRFCIGETVFLDQQIEAFILTDYDECKI